MALVNVVEKWSDTNGSRSRINIANAKQSSAARGFTVLFDGTAGPYDALMAAGVPSIGDLMPVWTGMACHRKRAVPLGPFLYEVVCEYWGKDSPLTEPDQLSWQEASADVPVDADADGDPLLNTVGDPLVGLTKEVADPVYVCTRNEATYPSSTMFAYWNAVNSDTILTDWVAETARMLPITASKQDDGVSYFWAVTYRIQLRADSWRERVPNKGKRYRVEADGAIAIVRDRLGIEEALLRENGTLLNDNGTSSVTEGGTSTTSGGSAEPTVWLTPLLYPKVAFAPLGIF